MTARKKWSLLVVIFGAAAVFLGRYALQQREMAGVRSFVDRLTAATTKTDSAAFKELIDDSGLYAITYFVDQRDPNTVLHLFRDEIRSDLVLANSRKIGGWVDGAFADVDAGSIPIRRSRVLSGISFDVDWLVNDEDAIERRLPDIVNTCRSIILNNNKDIPQVFELENGVYVLTRATIAPAPYDDCTGDWIIFERVGDAFTLRAVLRFQ